MQSELQERMNNITQQIKELQELRENLKKQTDPEKRTQINKINEEITKLNMQRMQLSEQAHRTQTKANTERTKLGILHSRIQKLRKNPDPRHPQRLSQLEQERDRIRKRRRGR